MRTLKDLTWWHGEPAVGIDCVRQLVIDRIKELEGMRDKSIAEKFYIGGKITELQILFDIEDKDLEEGKSG